MTWVSPSVRMPRTAWRVVLGDAAVIVTLVPTSWLTNVDLPTLGRPRMATNPARRHDALAERLDDTSSIRRPSIRVTVSR